MANDLTTTDRAAQSKAVAAFASSTEWTLASAMEQAEGVEIASVITGYERGLNPLSQAEPRGMSLTDPKKPGPLSSGLGDDLAMLSTKIAPTISTDQVDAWIKVMTIALADLPGRVAREGAQRAIHRPMKFLNEVETVIREEAEIVRCRHAMAMRRLRDLERAMRVGAQPAAPTTVALPPPIDPDRLSPRLAQLGIDLGFLVREGEQIRETAQ
jgi:hypothetical protein